MLIALTLMAGCQNPDEVHLTPGPAEVANQIEVTSFAPADTGSAAGSFDSSAVLPMDQARFGAFLSLNRVIDDFAVLGVRQVRSREFARVVFTDRNMPVIFNAKLFGYRGVRLDSVAIDGLRLFQITHFVPVPTLGNVASGYEYARNLAGVYTPGKNYMWNVVAGMNSARFSIQAPADFSLQSPIGGSKIQRNRPLELRWTGSGTLAILISEYYPPTDKARPLLYIKPAVNGGQLALSPRILALLPTWRQYFIITFLLFNRDERRTLPAYSAEILIQATSVYNCFVELQ